MALIAKKFRFLYSTIKRYKQYFSKKCLILHFLKKMKIMTTKSFKDWTTFDLEQTFGLQKQALKDCAILNNWLDVADVVADERINAELDDIRADLTEYADIWNEEELKGFFVFPLMRLVRFKHYKYKLFYERKLSVKRNNIVIRIDNSVYFGTIT